MAKSAIPIGRRRDAEDEMRAHSTLLAASSHAGEIWHFAAPRRRNRLVVSAAAAQLSKIDGLGSTGSSDPFSWRCSICFRGATVLHSSDANERITSRPDRAQPNRRSDTDNDDKNNGAVSRPARSDPFRPERLDRSVVSRAANKQLFCSINMSCAIDAAARLLRCYLNSSLRRMQIRRAPGATHTASGRICAPARPLARCSLLGTHSDGGSGSETVRLYPLRSEQIPIQPARSVHMLASFKL